MKCKMVLGTFGYWGVRRVGLRIVGVNSLARRGHSPEIRSMGTVLLIQMLCSSKPLFTLAESPPRNAVIDCGQILMSYSSLQDWTALVSVLASVYHN